MTKGRLSAVVVLTFMLGSGFVCTGSQLHKLRQANADLAATLAAADKAVENLHTEGVLDSADTVAALVKIRDATILSDDITACIDAGSPIGCIPPLLDGVKQDMTSLGIKSPQAQTALTDVVNGVLAVLTAFGGVK